MIYYLVSKDDFATLYRFGFVAVKSGASAESENPREAVQSIFSLSDNFEYAQERLIVECGKGSYYKIEISNVLNLYPLDEVSKGIYESQFSKSLIFREPIFKDIAEHFLKNDVMVQTTISGINALRGIFGFAEEQNSELINEIILGKTFLRREGKYFNVPLEQRSPYSILIAYNRYQHYPKDNRGFFFDAADCFMYGSMYASLPNPDDFLGYDKEIIYTYCKSYFNFLESIPKDSKFTSIVEIIERENPKINSAIESSVYGSIKSIALYFYMKDRIVAEGELSIPVLQTLYKIKEVYPNEFSTLLTLLGGFFGYTWFYDRLYEFTDSPILSRHYTLDDITLKKEIKTRLYDEPSSQKIDNSIQEVISHQEALSNAETKGVTSLNELDAMESIRKDDEIMQNQDLNIDVCQIAKLVFAKKSPRRNSFVEKLQENKEILIQLIKEQKEHELGELYPKLDIQYKGKEKERLEKFKNACLSLNNIQYSILIQTEDVNS